MTEVNPNWPAPNPDKRYDLPEPKVDIIPASLDNEIARLTPQEMRDTFDYFGRLDSYSLIARTSLRNMSLLKALSAQYDGDRKAMMTHQQNAEEMTRLLQHVELSFRDLTALNLKNH